MSESGRCRPDSGTLHLAQALSNRGRRGRKKDFRDAERLVKRLVSQELVLSFVPDTEQRMWRTLTRTRYQRTRDKVRLQNQLEALLEEAQGEKDSPDARLGGARTIEAIRTRSSHVCLSAVVPAFAEPDIHSLSQVHADRHRTLAANWTSSSSVASVSPSRLAIGNGPDPPMVPANLLE